MPILQLLYVSQTPRVFSATLHDIATRSDEANRKRNVTGLLVYSSGNFIQLLEGREAILQSLFEKIQKDPRHENVQQIYFEPTVDRLFPEWHMGLLDLSQRSELRVDRLRQAIEHNQNVPRRSFDAAGILAAFREFRQQMVGAKSVGTTVEAAPPR